MPNQTQLSLAGCAELPKWSPAWGTNPQNQEHQNEAIVSD